MFKEIFLFEIKYRLKRPATWAYFGILFVFGALIAGGGGGPASEKVLVNAPAALAQILATISIFGILLASAVMGVPVYRDIDHQTHNYFFSYPITEKVYILGRFLGSLAVLLLIGLGLHIGCILGFSIGPYLGFEEAERFAPFNFWHYLQPTLTIYWPNFFLAGCLFFALVTLTKRIMLAYAGGAVLFIFYLVSLTLVQDLETRKLVNLLDPFALGTFQNITRYWTPAEQNTQVVPFQGVLFLNRLIWVGLGLVIFLFTLFRFDFQRFLRQPLGGRKDETDAGAALGNLPIKIPKVQKAFTTSHDWRQMFRLSWLEFTNITRDTFFRAILLAAVAFLFFDAWFGFPIYGTPSLPLTYYMLETKDFTYIILVFVLIVFLTGETLHRERSVRYDQIFGALPLPNWVIYGSKFLALVLISFVLVNMILVSGMLNQVIKGYFNFEFGKYFTDMYLITLPQYILFVMLAFFVHSLVQKKFLGHVITIAIWVLILGLNQIGSIDYNLFFYSYKPGYTVSDMNGFGHFGGGIFWFYLYWLALGGILLVLGMLFWKRGVDSGRKARWLTARGRINNYSLPAVGVLALLFVGSGAFNYYNVSVLNRYRTAKQNRLLAVRYERNFSQYFGIPQPKVIDVQIKADVYPKERRTTIEGAFVLVNKTPEVIDSLHLNWGTPGNFYREVGLFTIGGTEPQLGREDPELGYQIYRLPKSLHPGDTVLMNMSLEAGFRGFPNEGSGSQIVYNGTFYNNNIFPGFGYDPGGELTSDKYRKKHNLPEKDYGLPEQTDEWGLSNLLFNDDADYITFEAVVSTSPDQIAVAPGYRQKDWEENGRRYFHYKMEGELDYFFNISSARYDVHREEWTGKSGKQVKIEVFHHPTHKYNLDRFVNGVKKSLDYYDAYFSPYQYRQIRILEFPRYATFAQSFPNTVPYAESFGFVGDFSDPEDLDYVFTVTAHEVAHQWWGHQVTPSATRGANQISESMAEYSSLMVTRREYGPDAMQDFLKRELDRYLASRAQESKFEKTLLDNDNQAYVWYRKGGLVLYAVQDYIGEERLNAAFRAYVDSAAFRPAPPFTTTSEWYGFIQDATPDSLRYFLEDSFEKITLYNNRVKEATYRKITEQDYEVTLLVESEKTYYDGNGRELEKSARANLIEIGIFDQDVKNDRGITEKDPIYVQKHWISPGESTLTFRVDKMPLKAGIDPYNKLIDRIPDDNLKDLALKE